MIDELLQVGSNEELRSIVAEVRPALDYKFYQELTARLEAAQGDDAAQLKDLRSKLLQITTDLDAELKDALRISSQLLQKLLQSADLKKSVSESLEQIDDSFMMVLQANMQQVAEQKQEQVLRALQALYEESRMPPDLKLINQLLRATPGDRAEYLRLHADEVTPEVMRTMAGLVNDLTASGRAEVANELKGLMAQAAAWQKPVQALSA